MKNEIVFSYRLIKLMYYLIVLYIAITYVNKKALKLLKLVSLGDSYIYLITKFNIISELSRKNTISNVYIYFNNEFFYII